MKSWRLVSFQDVGDDGGAATSNALGHADPGAINLVLARFVAQLLDHLDDLVDTGGSNRMAASFQPAKRGNGDASSGEDVTVQPQPGTSTAFGKTAGF